MGIQNIKSKLLTNIVWSIVDGKSTCTFDDCWASLKSHPIQNPPRFLENLVTGDQLIWPNSGYWSVELITKVFDCASASTILNTPICRFAPARGDTLVWILEKNEKIYGALRV